MDLDPDRRLALAYVPAAARPAIDALWRLDVTFGGVLATGREPMVTRIRLAWWREALEKLDSEPPPPEPVLRALAAYVVPAVSGAELAAMEDGWSALLSDDPIAGHGEARGGLLFRYTARLLGAPAPVEPAGARWALVDLARRTADPVEVRAALSAAGRIEVEATWPRPLRPLGMLAMLATRDIERGAGSWERQGSPARMLRMLRHRLTGR